MFKLRKAFMIFALALAGLLTVPAFAQYRTSGEQNAYNIGVADGKWDQTHTPSNRNRAWRSNDEARAYRDGYNDGLHPNNRNNNGGYYGNQNGRDRYRYDADRNAYDIGVADGRWDLTHTPSDRHRQWSSRSQEQAYRDGYNSIIRSNRGGDWGRNDRDRDHDWDRDRDWDHDRDRDRDHDRDRDGYGNGGYGRYNNNAGARAGYTDGRNDGSWDRANGFNYRPTEKYAYKNANHGLKESGQSKEDFVNGYKPAYIEGYKQGYYNSR